MVRLFALLCSLAYFGPMALPVYAQSPGAASDVPVTVDSLTIRGLRRSTDPVITDLLGLSTGDRMTSDDIGLARRRLGDLPTAGAPTLAVVPLTGGTALLTIDADERRVLPNGLIGWVAVAGRAVIVREIRVDMAGLLKQGDLWRPAYRWPGKRPRVGVSVTLPAPGWIPGVLGVDAMWERQTYARTDPDVSLLEERRRLGATLGDWATSSLRWRVGAFADRFDRRNYVAMEGETVARLWADHIKATARVSWWTGADNAPAFTTTHLQGGWRSTTASDRSRWMAVAGISMTSRDAPLAVWPGGDSGFGRGVPLRAHPLVVKDVVTGEVFGRRVGFASVEREQPVWRHENYGAAAVVAFVDLARAWERLDQTTPSRLHADVGGGVRLTARGQDGVLRLDLAVGTRDGRMRASAGYIAGW